jgi:hypothetical protein
MLEDKSLTRRFLLIAQIFKNCSLTGYRLLPPSAVVDVTVDGRLI